MAVVSRGAKEDRRLAEKGDAAAAFLPLVEEFQQQEERRMLSALKELRADDLVEIQADYKAVCRFVGKLKSDITSGALARERIKKAKEEV